MRMLDRAERPVRPGRAEGRAVGFAGVPYGFSLGSGASYELPGQAPGLVTTDLLRGRAVPARG